MCILLKVGLFVLGLVISNGCSYQVFKATGDLGVIVERGSGSVQLINTSSQQPYARIEGLGDLSHASVVFSRDERYAYVFGRDGGLSKIDLLSKVIENRLLQSGNSIGGAISQDGSLIAVSNYTPGGVRIFDSQTLSLVADIPATPVKDTRTGKWKNSKVVGLVDAPGNKFVFSLFDTNEIWIVEIDSINGQKKPIIQKFTNVGSKPYDALITPEGRFYIAGLFGDDAMVLLDLWHPELGVKRILSGYGKGTQKLPVYKMPHLEGWAIAGGLAFVPAVGQHEVLVINTDNWQLVGTIAVHGQPVFVMSRPDGRQIWVNFAFPDNDTLQIIDAETLTVKHQLTPGKGVLHMEFTPRGEHVWVSVRDANKVLIYDTHTLRPVSEFDTQHPSGIFFTVRAHQIGL